MEKQDIVRAWGRILSGYRPNLSIEITRECPLRCPGCYAYGDDHLGGGVVLRQLSDLKGQALVDGILALVRDRKPLHLSIVGGEPLVRFRELDQVLPQLAELGVHTQLVTSAVRPVPQAWASIPKLQVVVSIDGLQPEHDVRRTPATYDRILKHIAGQQITVHCTLTRQQARPGYVTEFTRVWAANPDVRRIWFSLYTPQRHASIRRPRLPGSSAESRGLHFFADDGVHFGGPAAADLSLPVRGESGLQPVRVHGVGRAGRGRRSPSWWSRTGQGDLLRVAGGRTRGQARAGRRGGVGRASRSDHQEHAAAGGAPAVRRALPISTSRSRVFSVSDAARS